jgi:hypothetical protein
MSIHKLGKLQRNALLLTALSTSDAEEIIDLDRRRRRGIARSSARAWSSSSRYLGLVFAPQGAARAPLCRCRRRSHQGGIFQFVFTTAGTAASPVVHQHTIVQIGTTNICHQKVALGGRKTLDEMWRKKTMWRRKLVMKGLGFYLAGVLYL